jgi:hypothetical protein
VVSIAILNVEAPGFEVRPSIKLNTFLSSRWGSGLFAIDEAGPLQIEGTTGIVAAAPLIRTQAILETLDVGKAGNMTLTLVVSSYLPANGKIEILFPTGFDASYAFIPETAYTYITRSADCPASTSSTLPCLGLNFTIENATETIYNFIGVLGASGAFTVLRTDKNKLILSRTNRTKRVGYVPALFNSSCQNLVLCDSNHQSRISDSFYEILEQESPVDVKMGTEISILLSNITNPPFSGDLGNVTVATALFDSSRINQGNQLSWNFPCASFECQY